MESKKTTVEEMKYLLELSTNEEHPYFYHFSYQRGRGFFADRVKKDNLGNRNESRAFHNTNISTNSALAKAVRRIEKAKDSLGQFTYAR